MKKTITLLPILFSVCIVLVAIVSWLGSIYGWKCGNLIDGDGLRWFVANFMDNIKRAPFEDILLFTLMISVVKESEIINIKKKKLYLKQKRAYMIVTLVALALIILAVTLYMMPGNVLLTAFGQFNNSPLQKGLLPFATIVVILLALIYGYAAGVFSNFGDMIKAMTALMVAIADYFITFIIAAQLFAVLNYTLNESLWWNAPGAWTYNLIYFTVFFVPWLLHIVYAFKRI